MLFVECSIGLTKLPHLVIDCFILKAIHHTDCLLYFRKALLEEESEWQTHQKIINISADKGGLRKQLPKGFPYFHVDFNL